MKANTNSWHSKLYSLTYSKRLPDNLCPYFWKLIIAIIVFIPNIIIQFPCFIIPYFKEDDCKEKRIIGFCSYFILLTVSSIIYLNYNLVKAIFNCYSYSSELANITAVFEVVILLAIGTILGSNYYSDHRVYKEKTPNILTEFIKAKYGKYCPKIEWIN